MQVITHTTKQELGQQAASHGAVLIREAIQRAGQAAIIVATGASQFEMLAALVAERDIRWDKVTAFHLDEYLGLEITHPASFRNFLWQRFASRLPLPLAAFHLIHGERNAEISAKSPGAGAGRSAASARVDPELVRAQRECGRLSALILGCTIDVAFVGIGENGHLAFNDPPADFASDVPYRVVTLDEACRRQQLGEGWFRTLDAVPQRAISMSIRQIMKSQAVIASVPDARKAEAVRRCVQGVVSPHAPASILQHHARATLYLDRHSASLLQPG